MKRTFLFILSVLVIAVSLPIIQPAIALAEVCDTDFLSNNNILFYSPCANTSCSVSSSIVNSTTIAALRGDNNGQKIFNFWVDAGMTIQQAAGITGSMKHEGGFSPFRQEMSQTWPAGGWGIAQFTHDPGQRGSAVAYVRAAAGEEMFTQYYKAEYGGAVLESNGFIPNGVPVGVNDTFLLGELNYLLDHIQSLEPNSTRRNAYSRDYSVTVPEDVTLYNYLKTLTQPRDAAISWTYLYEYPANIATTSAARGETADIVLGMYSAGTGTPTECGGNLSAGGMTSEQAVGFMDNYKNNPSNSQYIGTAAPGCNGGPLSNCVSFSMYFINKYTTIDGTQRAGNGGIVASNLVAHNPDLNLETGHSPRPFAVFSTAYGSDQCDGGVCGHTGVVLGVDTVNQKIIIGEAGCSSPASWDGAHEYDLADYDNESYTYVYTEAFLKGTVQ